MSFIDVIGFFLVEKLTVKSSHLTTSVSLLLDGIKSTTIQTFTPEKYARVSSLLMEFIGSCML